jgi:hypothetical protein
MFLSVFIVCQTLCRNSTINHNCHNIWIWACQIMTHSYNICGIGGDIPHNTCLCIWTMATVEWVIWFWCVLVIDIARFPCGISARVRICEDPWVPGGVTRHEMELNIGGTRRQRTNLVLTKFRSLIHIGKNKLEKNKFYSLWPHLVLSVRAH